MNAEEAKAITAKAKAEKLDSYRVDLLNRIEVAANSGNDNLVISSLLSQDDADFFKNLGYDIINRRSPLITYTNGVNLDPSIDYHYSEISWV